MNKKETRIAILAVVIIAVLGLSATASFSTISTSGYQSVTAQWYQVYWENAQDTGKTFIKPLSGSTLDWNPDATGIDSNGVIPDGWSDLSTIAGEVENPKFDRNIDYHDWWINDSVSESNPTGVAQHFEWGIDVYTMNVNIYAIGGTTYFVSPPQLWVELKNNVDSVFSVLGAEEATSYIIYAQTEEYSWQPESAGWHIISPTTGNFDIIFLDGSGYVPPDLPEDGSDLNFGVLSQYSDVALPFTLTQFGKAAGGSAPTVNMVVEINILTLGRFDYVLTYNAAGSNQIAPIGELGILDGIGAALGAGFGALVDGFSNLATAATLPLITIVVGVVIVVVALLFRRRR